MPFADAPVARPGLADPARDAQRIFRALLGAMAHPGRIARLERLPEPPPGFCAAAAALLLGLTDADTAVWTDADPAATAWLRFHSGCRLTTGPGEAAFVHAAQTWPPLRGLNGGTAAAPHVGATLILEVADLVEGRGWRLTGPGIDGVARLAVRGAPAAFLEERAIDHARYPVGIDVVLCAGDRMVALPRSTRVERG